MKTVKNYLFKSFVLLSCVCLSLAFVQCKSEKDKEIEKGLTQAAEMINAQTPIMMGEAMRLDNVNADGKTLTYVFTILETSNINAKELEENVRSEFKNQLGTNKQFQTFATENVVFKYKYLDKDGKPFAEFSFNLSDFK